VRFNPRYLLILPVLLGAFFMLNDLMGKPVWSDEYFTYAVVFEGGFPERVMADIHPPFYYILCIVYTKINPDGLFVLRLFSVLCGLVSIYVAFLLCRRYFGETASLVFLILMPINCHLILFTRMARYYIPLMLLILLAQLAFDRLLEKRNPVNIALYTVSLIACFYTNLVSILIVPAHITTAILRKKGLEQSVISQAIAVIALAPWLPVLITQLGTKGSFAPFGNEIPLSLMGFLARILWPLYDFSLGENVPPWDLALSAPAVLAVLSAAVWFFAVKNRRGEFVGYILWILVPLAILTGAVLPVGIEFLPTRATFLLPFWLMIIAAGISRMPRQLIPIPIIIFIAVSIVGNVRYFREEGTFHSTYIIPWREIASYADWLASYDGLIVADDESLRYYLPDDRRLMFLSILEVGDVTGEGKPIVLVVHPRDITPGARLEPFLDALAKEGYEEIEGREFLIEDEKTRSVKQKLLRREVSRAKKVVRLYKRMGGAKE
jgi:hypothetical protein